ncbi:MAG: MBL fold metallo-hydrolase [Panacagrimonas sp.]
MRRLLVRVLVLALIVVAALFTFLWSYRPGLDAYTAYLAAPAPPDSTRFTATWLGVTALLLRDGEHAVLIDPFFTRPPGVVNLLLDRPIAPNEALIRDWLQRLGVARLDAVLVSHSHYDHAMDAGVVARLTGAVLIGSPSSLQIGRGAGLDEDRLIGVESAQTVGPFNIQFIESRHAGATGGQPTGEISAPLQTPARYLDYKLGGAYSILIQHAQGALLHHGSAGFVPGALANHRADVVFLGAALIDDLPTYLQHTVDAVGAQRVIPTHWDDFTRPLDAPLKPFPVVVRLDRFFEDMARLRPGVQVQTLALGQPVELFAAAATSSRISP